jgi:hypothetical protein
LYGKYDDSIIGATISGIIGIVALIFLIFMASKNQKRKIK